MALHEQYQLRVTAGATYGSAKHQHVPVNTEKAMHISSDLMDAQLHMRVKDYRGTLIARLCPCLIWSNQRRSSHRLALHISLLRLPPAPL